MAAKCGGCIAATRHAFMAQYEIPITATLPLLQLCVLAHSNLEALFLMGMDVRPPRRAAWSNIEMNLP